MAYKYGRLAATFPVGLRTITTYMDGGLPEAPGLFDFNSGVTDWGMLGNDQKGNCAWAGFAHLTMANAAGCAEAIPSFTTDEVLNAYLAFTGGQDVGTNLSQLLAKARSEGVMGVQVDRYGPVNHRDIDEVWNATYAFDGLYIGVVMPAVAQEQFQRGEAWDLTGTDADRQIEGGHCVVLSGRNRLITWGQEIEVTDRWLQTYLEEAWVVITPELLTAKGDGHGIDLAHLDADLDFVAQGA